MQWKLLSVQNIVAPFNCAYNTGARWEGVPECHFLTGSSRILMFMP